MEGAAGFELAVGLGAFERVTLPSCSYGCTLAQSCTLRMFQVEDWRTRRTVTPEASLESMVTQLLPELPSPSKASSEMASAMAGTEGNRVGKAREKSVEGAVKGASAKESDSAWGGAYGRRAWG